MDRETLIDTLQGYFLKYMKGRGFPFSISGRLWEQMLDVWGVNEVKEYVEPDNYFALGKNEYEQFLVNVENRHFLGNSNDMFAVLWGSVYIYDFLKSIGIINDEVYNKFQNIVKKIKGKLIGIRIRDLWSFNFVHIWEKPESVSDKEFDLEEKIFRKSIAFKDNSFKNIKEQIKYELENIGELAEFIIDAGNSGQKMLIPRKNMIDEFLNNDFASGMDSSFSDDSEIPFGSVTQPIEREKEKVGRNDPCPCGSGKKYKHCCGR